MTERLSGQWTDTHSEEIKRGITIRLGYADASFYKCDKCEEPECYTTKEKCDKHGKTKFLRKVSFVDAPGHETLMATMLSGAAIMDAALLLIAANEPCPQPQTREHLMALEIVGINNIIIVQNKIDLVSEEDAKENYKQIKDFVKGTIAKNAPVIPISAQQKVNIDALIKAIEDNFPTPKKDLNKNPLMYIARSFDVNKPGTEIDKLVGGVLGGALKQGCLKEEDKIEIRPGLKAEKEGKEIWQPILTEVTELRAGKEKLNTIRPGGTAGILTKLDPSLVKADSLTGNVVGLPGKLPQVFHELDIKPSLLERVVGAKDQLLVEPIKKNETLMLNVNSAATIGVVTELSKDKMHIKLRIPVCATQDDRITLSRLLGSRFRLIGFGKMAS